MTSNLVSPFGVDVSVAFPILEAGMLRVSLFGFILSTIVYPNLLISFNVFRAVLVPDRGSLFSH